MKHIITPFLFLLTISALISSCSDAEPTPEELLQGSWQIANAGELQIYADMEHKAYLNNMPIQNSKIFFYPDGNVRGIIEKAEHTGVYDTLQLRPLRVEAEVIMRLLQEWYGKWELNIDGNMLKIEGPHQPKVVYHPITGEKQTRHLHFHNEMQLEFPDEETMRIKSEERYFLFKRISNDAPPLPESITEG